MLHAWGGYRKTAWGADEYKPSSGGRVDGRWGMIGMNILDSLSTLHVMGMKQEFNEAKDWVATQLKLAQGGPNPKTRP